MTDSKRFDPADYVTVHKDCWNKLQQANENGERFERQALYLETKLKEAREALKWFIDRESMIQWKFNLHGPADTAIAMRVAYRKAKAAVGDDQSITKLENK